MARSAFVLVVDDWADDVWRWWPAAFEIGTAIADGRSPFLHFTSECVSGRMVRIYGTVTLRETDKRQYDQQGSYTQ